MKNGELWTADVKLKCIILNINCDDVERIHICKLINYISIKLNAFHNLQEMQMTLLQKFPRRPCLENSLLE
jgi:hypothetical protein